MGSRPAASVALSLVFLTACSSAPQIAAAPASALASAPVASTIAPTARPAATSAATWWDNATVTIDLDAAIAPSVQDTHVAAASGPAAAPAHIDVVFPDAGAIGVYRVADLGPDYAEQLATLRSLLKDRITLRTRYPFYLAGTVGNFRSEPGLVAIPRSGGLLPAFYARPHYIDTTTFAGVAYLTQFVQTVSYVNIDHALYVVQSITRDGRYLIDARFTASSAMPRSVPALPADPRVANPSFDLFWINVVREIDFRPDGAFAPSLDAIDEMLASLHVTGP